MAAFFVYAYLAAGLFAFACLVFLVFSLNGGRPLGIVQYLLPLSVIAMIAAKVVAARFGRAND